MTDDNIIFMHRLTRSEPMPSTPQEPIADTNMLQWLRDACRAAGGAVVGSGFDDGRAEVWIELGGEKLEVTIRPLRQ